MKDSYSDSDPVEESAASRWFLDEHMETRFPAAASPSGADLSYDVDVPSAEPGLIGAEAYWPAEVREANTHARNRFAHFVLVTQVGAGESGAVFRAWDTRWKQYAGVKLLHSMEPAVLARFIREAPRVAHLRHPAVATTYEAGEHAGQWYVAMTYVEAEPIDADRRALVVDLELIRDACRALEFAHDQGVAHGNLKPANVLVDRLDRVYLTDFGIPNRHEASSVAGDIRALGATLHKLLDGRSETSPELKDVVARATDPDQGFATAGEFGDEIDRLLLDRRYSGTYGLPRQLARKWGPVAVAGVALAILAAWILPAYLTDATAAGDTEDRSTHYKRAAIALLRIEESDESRSGRIRDFVGSHLAPMMDRNPRFLHALVLKARAAFLDGDREGAKNALAALAEFESLDYRVGFFRALIDLEEALEKPLPLPAPEAPGPDWDGGLPDLHRFHGILSSVASVSVDRDSLLYAEGRRDAEAAQALLPLVEGQYRVASERLTSLTQTQKLPVYVSARRTAAYLARRFDEVLDEPGTQFALALDASNAPAEDVRRLGPLFDREPRQEATLLCWAARRCVAQGLDPEALVEEGIPLQAGELQGVLQIARLRWDSMSGRVTEYDYRDARRLLGHTPHTWMGRIAAIEALLGSGRSLKLRGGDGSRAFQEAIERADALPDGEGWSVPHLLRAEALLGLGRYAEALAEARRVQGSPDDLCPALLIASAASLRLAYQGGSPDHLEDATAAAERAVCRFRDHPEALTARAAASIFAAESAENPEPLLKGAIGQLTLALERVPEHLEARYHRASANYLLFLDSKDASRKQAAIADLDAVLQAVPELSAARALRGVLRGSVDDLRKALIQAQGPDREELQRWIKIFESRVK